MNIKDFRSEETPFYYYDMELLRRTLAVVAEESSRYGYLVHYAMKANFDEGVVAEIVEAGLGIDCVSGGEVRYAIEMGVPPSKIVFAGVGKSDWEINYALDNGIFAFNCESRMEMEVINSLAAAKGLLACVALRINPDINPNTHKYIKTGSKENKFGISPVELNEVIEGLPKLTNLNLIGLHFHIGSQILDMNDFRSLAVRVNEFQEWFEERGFSFDYINVGGGLGIDYDEPEKDPIPDFKAYFAVFAETLKLREGQQVHFELGRAIVGQCGTLVTKVLYNKTTPSGIEYLIVDAGMTDLIRPSLYSAHHKITNLSSGSAINKVYSIGGPVCESSDVFAKDIELPESHRGDYLAVWSAGAYGQAMASQYNLRPLPRSAYSDKVSK